MQAFARMQLRLLVFALVTVHYCAAFCMPCHAPPLRRQNLLLRLDRLRGMREEVRRDIVSVVEKQRQHAEGSGPFLRFEAAFLDLLNREDEIVMDIETVVKELTRHKTLSKNACSLYRSYIKDA